MTISWTSLAVALVAAVGASIIDWLFGGVLFHDRYLTYPEIWRRPRGGPGEARAVANSAAVNLLTPVVFVWLGATFRLGTGQAFLLAVAVWLIAAVPILLTQHFFVRLDPLVTASHTAGWLVKLLFCAAVLAFFF